MGNTMEEVIKKKTEELVKQTREAYAKAGSIFTEKDEVIFRAGISNGLMIGGLALINTPAHITLGVYNDETKNS